jgi:hypothetical protein
MVPKRGHGRKEFPHTPVNFDLSDCSGAFEESGYPSSRGGGYRSRPPKTEFPKFNGDNPKWWKIVCEKYFALHVVDHDTWASFATNHFVGNAALWLHTYEAEHDIEGLEDLCVAIHSKFGRDKHHKYLQALERCKLTHTVDKYFQKFEAMRHEVLVHNKHYDKAFFVTKFVNGIKKDIQHAIRLHKPRIVDIALALAETREEMIDGEHSDPYYRHPREFEQHINKAGYSSKGVLGAHPNGTKKHEEKSPIKPVWDDKLQALKCFICVTNL